MKKSFFIMVAGLFSLSITTSAQDNLTAHAKPGRDPQASALKRSNVATPSHRMYMNDRINRKFARVFPHATDAVWSKTAYGFAVRFTSGGIQTLAFLAPQGNVLGCIRYYSEKELPAAVRHQVKSVYYDYDITLVQEVQYNRTTAYLLTINGAGSWKVLRIVDGEMEVREEHEKS